MNAKSETDWPRLRAMADDDIDLSDSPELTEADFRRGVLLMPGEFPPARVRFDPKVRAWIQSLGPDWQDRVNEVLRRHVETLPAAG